MRNPGLYIICTAVFLSIVGNYSSQATAAFDVRLNESSQEKNEFLQQVDLYTQVTYSIDSLLDIKSRLLDQIAMKKRNLKKLTKEGESLIYEDGDSNMLDVTPNDSIIFQRRDSLTSVFNETNTHLAECHSRLDEIEKALEQSQQQLNELAIEIAEHSTQPSGAYKIEFRDLEYLIFKADLREHDINFHLLDPEDCTGLNTLNRVTTTYGNSKNEVLMVTNAGMYTQQRNPQGLYIENYDLLNELDTTKPDIMANFYLMPNGVFYTNAAGKPFIKTTQSYANDVHERPKGEIVRNATQSGPMLVIDGKLHDAFMYRSNNLHIRSGVGVKDDSTVIFAISLQRTNFHDFGTIFKDILGCDNALYLDGAISKMYVRDINEKEKGGNFGPMISVVKKQTE